MPHISVQCTSSMRSRSSYSLFFFSLFFSLVVFLLIKDFTLLASLSSAATCEGCSAWVEGPSGPSPVRLSFRSCGGEFSFCSSVGRDFVDWASAGISDTMDMVRPCLNRLMRLRDGLVDFDFLIGTNISHAGSEGLVGLVGAEVTGDRRSSVLLSQCEDPERGE